MKTPISLSIPKPCHENWNSFSPTAKGGFCASCQKEVIDFTSWSDDRIKQYFKTPGGTCGRFRQDQLKIYQDNPATRSRLKTMAGIFFLTCLSLFWSRPTVARATERQRPISGQLASREKPVDSLSSDTVRMVRGQVTDDEGESIPGVNVVVKNTVHGTMTDAKGDFAITLPDTGGEMTLVFSFIGMMTREIPVDDLTEPIVNVKLESDSTGVTETYAVQGAAVHYVTAGLVAVSVHSTPSPVQRIWNAVKTLFSSPVVGEPVVCEKQSEANVETAQPTTFTCSPNPVKDKLNVTFTESRGEKLITFSSIHGQVIEERVSMKAEEQFNVTGLAPGVYLVRVDGADGVQAFRVVKE